MTIVSVRKAARGLVRFFALAAVMAVASPAMAANYPLELVSPRAAGTSPAAGFAAMPSGHRIFKAYPGVPYNIRAVVIGGAYPYTFSLGNAPAGMSINSETGEITWASPGGTTATPTITVRDAEGSQQSSSWTISVTTAGFRFIDQARGSAGGSGTIDNPWQSLSQLHASSAPGEIVYFRAGTYRSDGIARTSVGTAWERVEFNGARHPMAWIAYPGEKPVIDFGYIAGSDPSALIRFQATSSTPLYLDGLEGRNFRNIGFQVISGSNDYTVIRRLRVHDMILGVDGENPAGIMFTSNYSDATQYGAVQDSEFFDLNNGGGLKLYSHMKLLVEDNVFRDSGGGFDLKAHLPRFEVRGNVFQHLPAYVLFGNMNNGSPGEPATGEIRFNNVNTPNSLWSLDVNQDGMAREIYVYRNTLVGRVRVRNVDGTDGPFRFYSNVIVNSESGTPSGSRIVQEAVSDPSRVVINNNLVGSPSEGMVDANGLLTDAYQRYVGSVGHQLGVGSPIPLPPSGLSVQ